MHSKTMVTTLSEIPLDRHACGCYYFLRLGLNVLFLLLRLPNVCMFKCLTIPLYVIKGDACSFIKISYVVYKRQTICRCVVHRVHSKIHICKN